MFMPGFLKAKSIVPPTKLGAYFSADYTSDGENAWSDVSIPAGTVAGRVLLATIYTTSVGAGYLPLTVDGAAATEIVAARATFDLSGGIHYNTQSFWLPFATSDGEARFQVPDDYGGALHVQCWTFSGLAAIGAAETRAAGDVAGAAYTLTTEAPNSYVTSALMAVGFNPGAGSLPSGMTQDIWSSQTAAGLEWHFFGDSRIAVSAGAVTVGRSLTRVPTQPYYLTIGAAIEVLGV